MNKPLPTRSTGSPFLSRNADSRGDSFCGAQAWPCRCRSWTPCGRRLPLAKASPEDSAMDTPRRMLAICNNLGLLPE